ncbi:hypothetical protein DM01DRAFT_349422 [Hesseltinella vesiculosa]|uniref:Uncharacterized protein n=1 Tax=Hesseltinella vesiculosa TaxID=101127 RepID=A0A1X2GMX7_9FUNG|nr:hypothetical protein DM01DRAFT_349422 [Hesseltinella vesiculosa]
MESDCDTSDDDYTPIAMASWGQQQMTPEPQASSNENESNATEGWQSLVDPNVKIGPNQLGSGGLHRKGKNYKPINEDDILKQRLGQQGPSQGKKKKTTGGKRPPPRTAKHTTSLSSRHGSSLPPPPGLQHPPSNSSNVRPGPRSPLASRHAAKPTDPDARRSSTKPIVPPGLPPPGLGFSSPLPPALSSPGGNKTRSSRELTVRFQSPPTPPPITAQSSWSTSNLKTTTPVSGRKTGGRRLLTVKPKPNNQQASTKHTQSALATVNPVPATTSWARAASRASSTNRSSSPTFWLLDDLEVPLSTSSSASSAKKNHTWQASPSSLSDQSAASPPPIDTPSKHTDMPQTPFSNPYKAKYSESGPRRPVPKNYYQRGGVTKPAFVNTPSQVAPPPASNNPIVLSINLDLDGGRKIPIGIRKLDDPELLAIKFADAHDIRTPNVIQAIAKLFTDQKAAAMQRYN